MVDKVNKKIQLLVDHFISRGDPLPRVKKQHVQIAALFVKATIDERLFDGQPIVTEYDQYGFIIAESSQKNKDNEEDAVQKRFEATAKVESHNYLLEIPYEDISKIIYEAAENIDQSFLSEKFNGFEFELRQAVHNNNDQDKRKIEKAYKKFKRHVRLAVAQKAYFLSINKQAESSANEAKSIADEAQAAAYNANAVSKEFEQASRKANETIQEAQERANKALTISVRADDALKSAKSIAEKAEDAALHAKGLAIEADALAKSTTVNYVTILGIFATIIITVFGGLNIVGSTVKLLEGNNKLVYLVFVVSLLMICLLTLVKMLTSWIGSLRENSKSESPQADVYSKCKPQHLLKNLVNPAEWVSSISKFDFFTKAVWCFFIAAIASAICIFYISDKTTPSTLDSSKDKTSTQSNVVVINTESNKPTEQPKPVDAKKE